MGGGASFQPGVNLRGVRATVIGPRLDSRHSSPTGDAAARGIHLMIQFRPRGFAALVLVFFAAGAQAQVGSGAVSLGASGASQDFDTLAQSGESAVLPTGWYFRELGGTTQGTYLADNGNANQGNTYS